MPQRKGLFRLWQCILQLALILWIVRVVVAMTALGLLLLGLAPQAQDLFVEFADVWAWRMVLFVCVMVVIWAMPTHYASRLLLDTDERFCRLIATQQEPEDAHFLEVVARWVPRLLGLLTFVAVLIAIWRSHLNLPILPQQSAEIDDVNRRLAELAALVVLAAAGFLVYVVKRDRAGDLPLFRTLKRLNASLAPLWGAISPGLADPPGSQEEADRNLGRLLLATIFVVLVAIFFVFGAWFAALVFPRATAVPFILGGWLPFLSYLSGAGRQLRAPLIVGLFVLISVLAVVLGDNHSVRRIDPNKTAGSTVDTSRVPLEAAVTLWMQESRCLDAPATCPRPIVIAAAGGASRAAFFTASIVGYFMQEASDNHLDPNAVRKRLFAISGVSGGAMGAVMVTAALNAKADSNDHPCVAQVELWYGEKINNWRDCFEALTSGDFLSANFFGLAFNDMLPFGLWRDRAAVLEDAWDDRYQALIKRADPAAQATRCKGLSCPFLSLRPRSGHWIPLLVLNGTSEATGGRIVTTALAPTYRHSESVGCPTSETATGCILFADADYFHDLLNYGAEPDSWFGGLQRLLLKSYHRGEVLDDVQLSTAAHNSARFPFMSPAGSVRNRDHIIVDRIVDGGYFENYGALSAKELALAVHAIQPELAPFVLVISNDPDDLLNPANDSDAAAKERRQAQREQQLKKARASVNRGEPVTDIVTPLTTVANARNAHGILGVDQLRSSLRAALPDCDLRMIPCVCGLSAMRPAAGRARCQ
jgi:hypothetical protein